MSTRDEREHIAAYWRTLSTSPTPWTPSEIEGGLRGDLKAAGLLRDALTDAIATEDRRDWLDPDDVDEMVDDVLACLRERSDTTRDYWLDIEDSELGDD